MTTAALVPAAGKGERLGPGTPKALRPLGGVPMLVHAVRVLACARNVDLVVVAAPADDVVPVRRLLADHAVGAEVRVVAGGATRQDSVRRALDSLPPDVDVVLVHDAARPLVPVEVVEAVASAVRSGSPAVIPVVPVVDTVKRVAEDGSVAETVDRSVLRAVQTPQGFGRDVLEAAHAAGATAYDVTDDAELAERAGVGVRTISGSEEAFKVTRPLDLVLAEAVLARRRGSTGA
ncbi:MAG: 2-C-methyl-D-erythritol 4-phosphate cytidylyltransferase [Actinomycetota bacterium]|nr:2-C-methyl-D-erythritol 4-phosphate cytidylyltransferase [Actinomycetota bacterium]